MHKIVLKILGFFRSLLQFIRVLILFIIIMILLYWIEKISSFNWSFLDFIRPILEELVAEGKNIASGSIVLINAVFEFKYIAAIGILLLQYFLTYLVEKGLGVFENIYDTGRAFVKKVEEDRMNKELQSQAKKEQKSIKRYQVYVAITEKKKYAQQIVEIDYKEQANLMNKFLIEKLGVTPVVYKNGFKYSFNNIENIDDVLGVFFKVINSKAPVNYIVCVQVLGNNDFVESQQFDKMINLNIVNRIITMPDTVWRYKFNMKSKYETVQIGDFQHEGGAFEVHEFKNDFGI